MCYSVMYCIIQIHHQELYTWQGEGECLQVRMYANYNHVLEAQWANVISN